MGNVFSATKKIKETSSISQYHDRYSKNRSVKKSQSYLETEYQRFTKKLKKDPRMKGMLKESLEPISIIDAEKMLYRNLKLTFKSQDRESLEYNGLKDQIMKFTAKEILSSLTYTKWENDFMGMIIEENDPYKTLSLMSYRLSDFLFKRIKKNIFLKMAKEYDKNIAKGYYEEVLEIVKATCRKAKLFCDRKVREMDNYFNS